MQVATNVAALNARRSLTASAGELSRSLQRLSSGLRINSARDDAAGLAISERMTTQVRGMLQAARNTNDGISMLQTAEGALQSLTGALQRIRELAVQAANGTNGDDDRAAAGAEASQLLAEIDRVAKTSTFNGQRIFEQNGASIGGDRNIRAVDDSLRMSWLSSAEEMIRDRYGLEADGATLQIDLTTDSDGVGGYAAFVQTNSIGPNGRGGGLRLVVDMADFVPPNLPNGGNPPFYADRVIAHEMVHAIMARTTNWASLTSTSTWFVEGAAEFIHGADERVVADVAAAAGATQAAKIGNVLSALSGAWGNTSADYSAGYIATRYLHEQMKAAGNEGGIKDFMAYLNGPGAPTMDQAIAHFFGGTYADQAAFLADVVANGTTFVQTRMNLTNEDTGAIGGLDADNGPLRTMKTIVDDRANGYGDDVLTGFRESWQTFARGSTASRTLSLQVGADVGQQVDVQLGSMSVKALGLEDIDLVATPDRAILHVDQALDYLLGQRATLGAQLARMESTISTLQTSVETTTASRSRIRDADYAQETASLVRSQILQQAGLAIAAQANASPRIALALLRR